MARQLSYRKYWNMRPSEFADGDQIAVKLVLVLGHGGDYAIYAGTTDMTDNEVARVGDKVFNADGSAASIGEAIFSTAIQNRHYRR